MGVGTHGRGAGNRGLGAGLLQPEGGEEEVVEVVDSAQHGRVPPGTVHRWVFVVRVQTPTPHPLAGVHWRDEGGAVQQRPVEHEGQRACHGVRLGLRVRVRLRLRFKVRVSESEIEGESESEVGTPRTKSVALRQLVKILGNVEHALAGLGEVFGRAAGLEGREFVELRLHRDLFVARGFGVAWVVDHHLPDVVQKTECVRVCALDLRVSVLEGAGRVGSANTRTRARTHTDLVSMS